MCGILKWGRFEIAPSFNSFTFLIDVNSIYGQEQDSKVVVNSLHPGEVVTNIARYWGLLNGADISD